jgi:hypothetical protein
MQAFGPALGRVRAPPADAVLGPALGLMFYGAVPKEAIEQVTRVVPFARYRDVFVGCSGSFRFDRAVKQVHPDCRIHSNDVSLLSCSIGALAVAEPFPMSFKGRLAFIEGHLAGQAPIARAAAIQVAQEMAKYRGQNAYALAHWQHYEDRFAEFLELSTRKLAEYMGHLDIASYYPGDFRDQAGRALAAGGVMASFPPTYKNDYEKLFRFVDENADWNRPAYRIWDPKDVEGWIDELKASGVNYCVLVEHKLARHEPRTVFHGSLKPVYTYSNEGGSSVKRPKRPATPFAYRTVDVDALTPQSRVEIVNATSKQMNFLKDSHLAKEIQHTEGLANHLVFLDGGLAGGFIYTRSKFGDNRLYLLCDFSLGAKTRLSKLIVMLATSEITIRRMEIQLQLRIEMLVTTAYTTRPVSMKYRGVFDLLKREPTRLFYGSQIRRQTAAEIYTDWWQRFFANARLQSGPEKPQAARKERPVYEGAAV